MIVEKMIDLKNLREIANEAIISHDACGSVDLSAFQVIELLDMLDAAQKNNARYQWLRDECTAGEWGKVVGPYSSMLLVGTQLDSAIDAAMKTKP